VRYVTPFYAQIMLLCAIYGTVGSQQWLQKQKVSVTKIKHKIIFIV